MTTLVSIREELREKRCWLLPAGILLKPWPAIYRRYTLNPYFPFHSVLPIDSHGKEQETNERIVGKTPQVDCPFPNL